MTKKNEPLKEARIYGLPLVIYVPMFLLVSAALRLGVLPGNFPGILALLMIYGGLFSWLGDHLPFIRSYLGGGTIMCLFGSAALAWFRWFPEETVGQIDSFLNTTGFLEFFIAALIAGSILSMDRELLIKSAVRFLPVAFCSMGAGIAAVAAAGLLMGVSARETILFIAIPMMSGGMGAGVIPLSGMYAAAMDMDAAQIISRLIPASTLGNISAILMAALLYQLGRKKPSLTGNGRLVRNGRIDEEKKEFPPTDIKLMGTGMIAGFVFYIAAQILNRLFPVIHAYAWMILLTAGAKAARLVPAEVEEGARQWSSFVIRNWTSALLIGIGVALIDLDAVMLALTPSYLLLIIVITVAVTAGAAIGGYLVGFYPIESAITAGLCTINMGGSGNIAILSASRRMELLAFAQLATRICGSLVLVLTSVLLRWL